MEASNSKLGAGQHKSETKEHILFVGNPGVGKSAICNALGAECISGTRTTAVTTEHSLHEVHLKGKKVCIVDVPGLYEANETNVERNLNELSVALRYIGKYRLIFVICLQAGKLQFGDTMAMRCIAKAIQRSNAPIGVILNKLDKNEMKMLEDRREEENLKQAIMVACGADTETNENFNVSFFKIPCNGVGDDWHGKRPHADLAEWLLGFVSTDIIFKEEIKTPSPLEIESLRKEYDALLAKLTARISETERKRPEMERLERSKSGRSEGMRIMDKSDLLVELDRSTGPLYLTVPALFGNKKELVEIQVNKKHFKISKDPGWQLQTGYWVMSSLMLFANTAFSWTTKAIHINTPQTDKLNLEVTKAEIITEDRTTYARQEVCVSKDTYDSKDKQGDGNVRLNEQNSIETKITHSLGAEVGEEDVRSILAKCQMSLPNFVGSGEVRSERKRTASVKTANQNSTELRGSTATEISYPLVAGSKLVIERWYTEESWTTHYSTKTSYDGFALWCGSRGDKRVIPAAMLWPAHVKEWQVTQTRKERKCNISSAAV